jgi:hypothetical protein
MDQSAQRRVVGVPLGNQSRKNPYPSDGDVVGDLLHDVCHSLPASSSARSGWPAVARGSLEDVVVGAEVLAHAEERAMLAHDWLTTRGCQAHGPRQNECGASVTINMHY